MFVCVHQKINYYGTHNIILQKGMTAVHIASMRGNVEALKLLLRYGGNPNVKCQVVCI